MKWKEFYFHDLVSLSYGGLDSIIKMHFTNGDTISFLAGSLWGKEKEVTAVKNELQLIIDKYSGKKLQVN